MNTFPEVFGTCTPAIYIEPKSLAIMIAAAAFNLTGARNIIEDAHQYNDSRIANMVTAFADCAQFIQKCYRRNPNACIEVLSTSLSGMPCHAIVTGKNGEILFDPKASTFGYCLGNQTYSYSIGNTQTMYSVVARSTIREAVDALSAAGFWVDRAWNWDEPVPRASNYL